MEVGVESQSAILYVEGEGVDIKVTGADDFDRFSIVYITVIIQVHVRDFWGCVLIHTARQETSRVMSEMSAK